jgi:hypothetical protein
LIRLLISIMGANIHLHVHVSSLGVDCCHANQDKFWVEDRDGVEWEMYHLNCDLEPAPRAAGLTIASEPGCCGR